MKKYKFLSVLLTAVLCLALCACSIVTPQLLLQPAPTPAPEEIYGPLVPSMVDEYISSIISADAENLLRSRFSYEQGAAVFGEGSAEIPVTVKGLDTGAVSAAASEGMQAMLEERVAAAAVSSDIYLDDLSVKPKIAEELFTAMLESLNFDSMMTSANFTLKLEFDEQSARVLPDPEFEATVKDFSGSSNLLESAKAEAAASLEYVRKHYTVTTEGYVGPVANPNLFGTTEDPYELAALLETPLALQLLDGRELAWSPEIERLPGSQIYYYLDETILAIVWQEVTSLACGTYAEIIVADGSQFGRKLVNDTYGAEGMSYATKLAQQTNSVIAISGDLYMQPGRHNGIGVYEGQVYRFEPASSDTMYVDYNGKLYFTRRNEIATKEDAQAFVDENNISFSVAFGPLMVYDYENVTPEFYKWGEIYDHYARCAFGEIHDNHYLALTVNCKQPGYWYLVQLFDARNAMMEHGCRNVYALDGGQTASIIINGELINPVQFGSERYVSDIMYFTTALPSYEEG